MLMAPRFHTRSFEVMSVLIPVPVAALAIKLVRLRSMSTMLMAPAIIRGKWWVWCFVMIVGSSFLMGVPQFSQ